MTEIRELLQFIKEKNPQESERIFKQIVSERIANKIEEIKKYIFENLVTEETESLSKIAYEIEKDWKNVNYAARPYLDAMKQLDSINDKFGYDDARSIVLYFLSNASSWRGPKAKEIKDKLKKMVARKSMNESEETETDIFKLLELLEDKYSKYLSKSTISLINEFLYGEYFDLYEAGLKSDFYSYLNDLIEELNKYNNLEIKEIAKKLEKIVTEKSLKKVVDKPSINEDTNIFKEETTVGKIKNLINQLKQMQDKMTFHTRLLGKSFFDGSAYDTMNTGKSSDFYDRLRSFVITLKDRETDPEILKIADKLKKLAGEEKFYGKPEYPYYEID